MMKRNTFKNNFLRNYWRETTIAILSASGIALGMSGFCELGHSPINGLYETFRLFLLNYQFGETNLLLEIARWLIFIVFLLATFKLFITIVAPQYIQQLTIRWFYKNHVVICGLNEITMVLIEKFADKRIVVIAAENNQHTESLKQRRIKTIISDATDETILQLANIRKAKTIYAITDSDLTNIEIAQTAFSTLKPYSQKIEKIECYTLIKDRELKTVMEETALFKYTVTDKEKFFFDAILFNINEAGIKYAVSMNIDKIVPAKMNEAPEILIVGLNDKAENVLLNLAHCLTMNRENFRFTIAEENQETIKQFKQKYAYLEEFATIEFTGKVALKNYASIFVCLDNQTDVIKKAVSIRYMIGANEPNIIVFYDESDSLKKLLNEEGKPNYENEKIVFPFETHKNIYLINLFEEAAKYVIALKPEIEIVAKAAHESWREKDKEGNFIHKDEYERISEHFKQTNRNQIMDNYLRTYIATGMKFGISLRVSLVDFNDTTKETLAIMEHRRWIIEKKANGWQSGKREKEKQDEFKRHDCFLEWEKLPQEEKDKDKKAIVLMIDVLNNPNKYRKV